MTFFFFLFFGVFFALVLIGMQASARIGSFDPNRFRMMTATVNDSEVKAVGSDDNIQSIIDAMKEKSRSSLFAASAEDRWAVVSQTVAQISLDLNTVKTEIFVFKMILAGFAFIFGFASAFVALTGKTVDF